MVELEKYEKLLIAIDPGDEESGYVVVMHDGEEIRKVLECGKVRNIKIFEVLTRYWEYDLAIEMIASYGMAVGKSVFDTCVWIGRFQERAKILSYVEYFKLIYRKDEKMNLCGTMKAKDANIRQALIDRYAPNTPNGGKGTVKNPGFFYGFKADIWQAFAVAVTYFDLYVKGSTNQ